MLALLTAALLAQCASGITDGAQTFCGAKSMPQGAVIGENSGGYPGAVIRGGGVWLDGPYSYVQTVPGSGAPVFIRDNVATGSSAASFSLQTYYARWPWSEVLRLTNYSNAILIIYGDGSMVTGTIRTMGHSGAPSLMSATGAYLGLTSDLPPNYSGEHGALSTSNNNPCVAHNLIQSGNGRSGTGARTDYAFNISCRGGWYSRDLINSWELPVCNNGLGEPPEPNNRAGPCLNLVSPPLQGNSGVFGPQTDGGYCYDWTTYFGPDGGMAKAGETFGFVADVGEGCQCVPAKYDGGASPAGWFRLSDRSECRP